jgi:hypothetical protein
MYNENLLGISDVSILKFYYVSFKIQQGKGKVSDVGDFLKNVLTLLPIPESFLKYWDTCLL